LYEKNWFKTYFDMCFDIWLRFMIINNLYLYRHVLSDIGIYLSNFYLFLPKHLKTYIYVKII
jgi:hypothetical protein